MRRTGPQRRLLRWLRLADDYSRRVWGGELRTARSLVALGLVTCEWDEDAWFATVTPAGKVS